MSENTRKFFVSDAPTAFILGNGNNLEEPLGKICERWAGIEPGTSNIARNDSSDGLARFFENFNTHNIYILARINVTIDVGQLVRNE